MVPTPSSSMDARLLYFSSCREALHLCSGLIGVSPVSTKPQFGKIMRIWEEFKWPCVGTLTYWPSTEFFAFSHSVPSQLILKYAYMLEVWIHHIVRVKYFYYTSPILQNCEKTFLSAERSSINFFLTKRTLYKGGFKARGIVYKEVHAEQLGGALQWGPMHHG